MRAVIWVGAMSFFPFIQAQEPAAVNVEGLEFIPMLSTEYFVDDNVTRSQDDEIDSSGLLIMPQLGIVGHLGANQFSLNYQGTKGTYQDSEQDDYTDHLFDAEINLQFGHKHFLDTKVGYEDGHDDRGTAYSIGAGASLTEPDRYQQSQFATTYTYGSLNAEARIQLKLARSDLDYEIETDLYRLRDRSNTAINGVFYYQIAANTDLLVDVGISQIDYDFSITPESRLDSSEKSIMLGAQWDVTGVTKGFAKLGYQQKAFDVDTREKFDGLTWQVGLNWLPLSYSRVDLSTQSGTRETNAEGDFIRSRSVALQWQHDWLDRLTTGIGVRKAIDTYEGGAIARQDDIDGVDAFIHYQAYRWLAVRLVYEQEKRDSDIGTIRYDRSRVGLQLQLSL